MELEVEELERQKRMVAAEIEAIRKELRESGSATRTVRSAETAVTGEAAQNSCGVQGSK